MIPFFVMAFLALVVMILPGIFRSKQRGADTTADTIAARSKASSGPLTRLLWVCAGASPEQLEAPECHSERQKYTGLGVAVILTGVVAGLSGGYAFYSVFQSYGTAVAFGMIWGVLIFNLDRLFVMSVSGTSSVSRRLISAVPRFALAILIGLVISKPLELVIFAHEIDAQLEKTYAVARADAFTAGNS